MLEWHLKIWRFEYWFYQMLALRPTKMAGLMDRIGRPCDIMEGI